ncbi:MAG: TonB-dependent receptor [Bacteroidia bacterium]|nr:TonB-dependent receptor [Bacteroidia bacterium]
MKIYWLTGLLILVAGISLAQKAPEKRVKGNSDYLKGRLFETNNGNDEPLAGVSLFWSGTRKGTLSDSLGNFTLKKVPTSTQLVIRRFDAGSDTVEVAGLDSVAIRLKGAVELEGVEITFRVKSTEISRFDPIKVENIGRAELLKAACCNLSESFETNPSVDVAFTDAISGTKQIRMLGLTGIYTQITQENIPAIRGLSALYGLNFIPGTMIESIQMNKGTGSVANGFESIAGQINVELFKPEGMDKAFFNLYANQGGRVEANANLRHKFNDNLSTGLLLHGRTFLMRNDRNHDGFLDMPQSNYLIGLNRWKYMLKRGWRGQAGIKGTYVRDLGGQLSYDPDLGPIPTNGWGMRLNLNRVDVFTKMGKVWEEKPWKSLGIQVAGSWHDQQSHFGLTTYDATQTSGYANVLYQSLFGSTDHKFKTGASLMYDNFKENLNGTPYLRTEIVPGAFFEYTYSFLTKFNVVAGLRADYNNYYGFFATPRLHLRYAPRDNWVFRASAGRGQRTANVIAENTGYLASARQWVIQGDGSNKPYGLNPEVAWNYGINATHYFKIDYREGSVSLDFYRTDFTNQIVIDLDQSPGQVLFYNLDGQSWSNSAQIQADYEVIKRLDARIAYRWYDVKTTYSGVLRSKPLVANHRAFLNLAYATRNAWKFDGTLTWTGPSRVPSTASNPVQYQRSDRSPAFFLLNAQISKTWKERLDLYFGGENLLNFRQPNPIIASDQPFGPYFDSALIWGPIFGRNVYAGLRYTIR